MGASKEQFNNVQVRFSRAYHVSFRQRLSFEDCHAYFRKFLKFYEKSRASLVLLSEYDIHALTPDDLALTCSSRANDFLLTPGAELFDPTFDVGNAVGQHANQKDLSDESFDIGYKILEERKAKVASLPHVIAPDEFASASEVVFRARFRRLVVPGAPYLARRAAIASVVRKLPIEYSGHLVDKAMSLGFRAIPKARARNSAMWSYFRETIERSWLTFTCGSTAGYLVRKFFEVPAFGSCLCTFDYAFLPRCGLNRDLHYLPITEIGQLRVYTDNLRDDQFVQRVIKCASASRTVVLQCHSAFARYQQLSETLARMSEGSFCGSYWENGEYKFRLQSGIR